MNLKGKVLSISVSECIEEATWASENDGASLVYAGPKAKRLSFEFYPIGSDTSIGVNDIPMDLEMAERIATAFENGSDIGLTLSVK